MSETEAFSRRLRDRAEATLEWLNNEAPYVMADQRHLQANTPERAYWHYGYATALRDAQNLLAKTTKEGEDGRE